MTVQYPSAILAHAFKARPSAQQTIVRFAALLLAAFSQLAVLQAQSNYATPYVFTTIAGAVSIGSTDGTGSAARFNGPWGVAVDSSGNIYVVDRQNDTIRKITPAGVVTTLAGSANDAGWADGPGSTAQFNLPEAIAVDGAGNVYVADTANSAVRMITPAGVVSTLAGYAGNEGSADGTGTAASFISPQGIAVDDSGNVYVADTFNSTIRKITPTALSGVTNWVVSTIAGSARTTGSTDGTGSDARFNWPRGIAVDSSGNVYVADSFNSTIRKITPTVLNGVTNWVVSTIAGSAGTTGSTDGTGSAAQFESPQDVTVDGSGDVYVADTFNSTIRKITPTVLNGVTNWVVTTIAGSAETTGSADGTGSDAQFCDPFGVALDGAGNIYVADFGNNTIRKIAPTVASGVTDWVVTTFAGSARSQGAADGTGGAALFDTPWGVALDGSGNVYVADTGNNTIRKIAPTVANGVTDWVVTTIAGAAGSFGSTDGTGSDARFSEPNGLTVDSSGNIYVADSGNQTIRKVTPTVVGGVTNWVVTTLAGSAGSSGSADGAGTAARFNLPAGVAVDSSDNVYVADSGNQTIRKVTLTVTNGVTNWVVTTIAGTAGTNGLTDGTGTAAQFWEPEGVAVDSVGNLYIADSGNAGIRKITPTVVGGDTNWIVTTIAGGSGWGCVDGTGTAARFSDPCGVAVDGAGHVYVVDTATNLIRKITPTVVGGVTNWVVTTLAGCAGKYGSADGTGSSALFDQPGGIAADSSGNVYVADVLHNTIRAGSSAAIIPAITAQPVSQVVNAGGSVSFSVAASGPPATLTYQWQRLPSGSSTWTDLTEGSPYSGTATATLTVSNTKAAMNGDQFRCVVSNGGNQEVSSLAATLTMFSLSDPAFLQQLYLDVLGRPIDSGGAASFGAALAGGESRADVLGNLLTSSEYSAWQVEQVIRLYYAALVRCPDYAGLQNWSNALHAGVLTLDGAGDQFASSAEFLQDYGNLDNTAFVQQLYLNVLGRPADPAGLNNWVGELNTGTSRGTVLIGFSESPEFQADMANQVEIIRLYYLLMQRMPSAAELQGWIAFLNGDDQTDTLFALAYPSNLSDSAYVQAVFQGFLCRAPDAGALYAFTTGLAAGTVTHGSLVDTVLNSTEFNSYVGPVSRLYLAAFSRIPDQPGLINWVNYAEAGNSPASVADTFTASQEFTNRYGAMSDSAYVTALYQNVLGRAPDSAGLTNWTGLLACGTSRGGVLIGFSQSTEGIGLFAPTLRTFLGYYAFLNTAPTQSDLIYWKNYLTTLDDQMRETLLADMTITNGS